MAKRKKRVKVKSVTPDFITQQRESLIRKYRKAIRFNEKELSLINSFCAKYNIKAKSAFFRDIIISHILEQIDENYPKLF